MRIVVPVVESLFTQDSKYVYFTWVFYLLLEVNSLHILCSIGLLYKKKVWYMIKYSTLHWQTTLNRSIFVSDANRIIQYSERNYSAWWIRTLDWSISRPLNFLYFRKRSEHFFYHWHLPWGFLCFRDMGGSDFLLLVWFSGGDTWMSAQWNDLGVRSAVVKGGQLLSVCVWSSELPSSEISA